jgi:hypothetical protein
LKHTASRRFWHCFDALPAEVKSLAEKNFALLKFNSVHPSLHFKALASGKLYSVRVGISYRALGVPTPEGGVHWFWIGTHAEYDKLIA